MQRIETSLPGVFELRPDIHRDARGFFIETFHKAKFAELGIADPFVQDNHSCSSKGTLHGLHYQLRHQQAKICRVVESEALDVAADIRVGSPNIGKWSSVLLSVKEQNQIYVPIGFVHGYRTFCFIMSIIAFLLPSAPAHAEISPDSIAINWGGRLIPVSRNRGLRVSFRLMR
jgi:dTDP-4-dehydrorhamnose 3,5-epimerase